MAGEGSNKTSRGGKATTQKVAATRRQPENQRQSWQYFLYKMDCWLASALDPVFGRISVMDNPSNSFSVWLWSSVGITLPEMRRETGCIFSCDSGLCDEQKSSFCPSFSLFWKYLFQLELQKISCPRLYQNNACVCKSLLEMGVGVRAKPCGLLPRPHRSAGLFPHCTVV